MMKTNSSLKCKNALINELNKEYFVMPNFNGNDEVEKNTYIVGGIDDYICSVVPCKYKGSDCVTWHGIVYQDVKSLIDAVNEYNSHLDFPSYTYNPMFTPWSQIEKQIHWYVVDKLKCECDWESQKYTMKTDAGDILVQMSYNVSMEEDEAKRHNFISFYVGSSCYHMEFKDAKEACSYINSMVMTQVAGYFAGSMQAINILKDVKNFGDMSDLKFLNANTLSVVSAKQILIDRLESILAMLK